MAKRPGKYRRLFALALSAAAVGRVSTSAGAPAHQVEDEALRRPPIINVEESQPQRGVALITNWIEHYAKDTHPIELAGKFAKRLGLNSGQDIQGSGVSYHAQGSDVKEYFFIILPGAKTVLVFKDSDFIVYWLINQGALESTAYEDSHRDLIVPNETYRDAYRKIIGMFLDRARQETSDDEPSSQASDK